MPILSTTPIIGCFMPRKIAMPYRYICICNIFYIVNLCLAMCGYVCEAALRIQGISLRCIRMANDTIYPATFWGTHKAPSILHHSSSLNWTQSCLSYTTLCDLVMIMYECVTSFFVCIKSPLGKKVIGEKIWNVCLKTEPSLISDALLHSIHINRIK